MDRQMHRAQLSIATQRRLMWHAVAMLGAYHGSPDKAQDIASGILENIGYAREGVDYEDLFRSILCTQELCKDILQLLC